MCSHLRTANLIRRKLLNRHNVYLARNLQEQEGSTSEDMGSPTGHPGRTNYF